MRFPDQEPISKPLAVLDTHLRLSLETQALALAKTGLIYHLQGQKGSQSHTNCVYYPMPIMPNGYLDLAAVLEHLGSLGYHDVWVEAGAKLFTALHQAGLVNRTHMYIAPSVIGKKGLSLYENMDSLGAARTITWQPMDDNVMLTIDW